MERGTVRQVIILVVPEPERAFPPEILPGQTVAGKKAHVMDDRRVTRQTPQCEGLSCWRSSVSETLKLRIATGFPDANLCKRGERA
jgi:hypothetical protein